MQASVIIPTANRPDALKNTLLSFQQLDFPHDDYEIIVVDNGKKELTEGIVNDFSSGYPEFRLRYFADPVPGLLTGRHRGAEESNSDILIFIDDDIEVSRDWLKAILKSFEDPEVVLVGGKNLPRYESEVPEWVEQFWKTNKYGRYCGWLSLLDFGNEEKEIDPNYVWGLNFSIRKNALHELGGFHPDNIPSDIQYYQGDGETGLTQKAKEKNYKAVYNPKALIHHVIPASRLTHEYFHKRAFYQGVCDSFSEIRKRKAIVKNPEGLLKKLKKLVKTQLLGTKNPKMSKLAESFESSRLAGFNYHRKHLRSNPKLLAWVLKENYFDYKLPA